MKLAVRNNNPEMARILLEAGAYIGDVDSIVDKNNKEVIEVLKGKFLLPAKGLSKRLGYKGRINEMLALF